MGTENEDPNQDPEEEEETEQTEDNKLIRDLRKQLRAKDKELTSLRPLKETVAFHDAGLGSLSEDHKTALKAVAGDDFTKDNLIAKAKTLGFSATTDTSEETRQQQEIQQEVQTINGTETAVSRPTAKPDNKTFVQRLNEAKTQQEAMEIIATYGEAEGLLVETEF
jgi:hypothetical protein